MQLTYPCKQRFIAERLWNLTWLNKLWFITSLQKFLIASRVILSFLRLMASTLKKPGNTNDPLDQPLPAMNIDPLGRPTITAGRDHYFHKCFQSIHLHNEGRTTFVTILNWGSAEWIKIVFFTWELWAAHLFYLFVLWKMFP